MPEGFKGLSLEELMGRSTVPDRDYQGAYKRAVMEDVEVYRARLGLRNGVDVRANLPGVVQGEESLRDQAKVLRLAADAVGLTLAKEGKAEGLQAIMQEGQRAKRQVTREVQELILGQANVPGRSGREVILWTPPLGR